MVENAARPVCVALVLPLMRAVYVALVLGLLLGGPSPAWGAHEWRAAWAAPYPLEVLEDRASRLADSTRATAALAIPFEIPGLKFQTVGIRSGGGCWEMHAGVLQGQHYREWHVGVGRRLGLGSGVCVLLGARVFAVDAGSERTSPCWSGTILARGSPHGLRHLELEAGIVDVSLSHEEDVPSVLVTRALLSTGNARLIAERSVSSRGFVETTIVAQISFGPVATTYGYRCSVGETSTGLAIRSGAIQVRLSQRWHPVLGWTPRVAVCWLAASRA